MLETQELFCRAAHRPGLYCTLSSRPCCSRHTPPREARVLTFAPEPSFCAHDLCWTWIKLLECRSYSPWALSAFGCLHSAVSAIRACTRRPGPKPLQLSPVSTPKRMRSCLQKGLSAAHLPSCLKQPSYLNAPVLDSNWPIAGSRPAPGHGLERSRCAAHAPVHTAPSGAAAGAHWGSRAGSCVRACCVRVCLHSSGRGKRLLRVIQRHSYSRTGAACVGS